MSFNARNIRLAVLITLIAFLGNLPCNAQDLETLVQSFKQKLTTLATPPSLTGAFTSSGTWNEISGQDRRQAPFAGTVGLNLNFAVSDFSMPFNMNLSSGRFAYNYDTPRVKLPAYNFVGVSPKYKWATVHLGDRSMTFSPYTLSGHSFKGVGTELKPGKFEFSAMYGRLRRAQAEDLNALQSLEPAYRRFGWGFKGGYNGDKSKIALIFFRGYDDPNSIPPVTSNPQIHPEDNTVISILGEHAFGEVISLKVDYALSALSRNINSPEFDTPSIFQKIGGMFQPNISSGYYNAVKSTLGFKLSFGEIGLNHEWVDPGYRTLGALFFNNDFENWTISTKTSLFEQKLTLDGEFGIQRNNVRNTESTTSRRAVGAINLGYAPTEAVSLTAAYSNMQNTSKLRTLGLPFFQVDSIILSQVNQSVSFGTTVVTGDDKNSSFNILFSYNNANSIENDEVQADQETSNYLSNLTYSYLFTESKLNLSLSGLANYNVLPGVESMNLSPSLSASMPFFDETLKSSLCVSYVAVSTNKKWDSNIFSVQSGFQYTFMKAHNLGLTFAWVKRGVQDGHTATTGFSEFTGGVNYAWSFKVGK